MAHERATFGAGCFWGVEVTFRNVPGVVDAIAGYSGGTTERPTYEEVCRKGTGHAEVVQVTFDPEQVSYDKLLDVFFTSHDPTQLNRQGPDVGDQYRSVVFVHDDAQRKAAEAAREKWQASGRYRKPIVTVIEPARPFWPAEEYHQRYLEKRGLASCHV
jgi:peptide-methionine (S)-S-oxide reductase